jgi:hypothetical protein
MFSPKLIKDEIIGLSSVTMIKDERMAKVDSVSSKIWNREHISDNNLAIGIHILIEHNRRFSEIRSLT